MPATTRLPPHASRDCARRDAGRVTRGSASAWVIARVSGRERPNAAATSSRARSFRHAHPPASAPARALGFWRYASGGSRCRGKRAPRHARARAVVASGGARGGPGPRAHPETPHRHHAPRARGGARAADPRSRRLRRTRRLPRLGLARASVGRRPVRRLRNKNENTPERVYRVGVGGARARVRRRAPRLVPARRRALPRARVVAREARRRAARPEFVRRSFARRFRAGSKRGRVDARGRERAKKRSGEDGGKKKSSARRRRFTRRE